MESFKKELDDNGNFIQQNQLLSPNFQGNALVSYTIPYLHVAIDYTSQVYSPMKLPVYPNDYRPAFSPWFSFHNVQISKNHHHSTYYIGIKNIFDFVPQNPILRPFDPFDKNVNDPLNNPNNYTFDPNYNYAPLQGIRAYVGIRLVIK
jgi:outer membrane receptor for ferrienterochelin and colicins